MNESKEERKEVKLKTRGRQLWTGLVQEKERVREGSRVRGMAMEDGRGKEKRKSGEESTGVPL